MSNLITALQKEVLSLIQMQSELFSDMLKIEGIWSEEQEKGSLSPVMIRDYLRILAGEAEKAGRLEAVVAVVGTMKAGKSTTINAIVGDDILPNRELAMTTLPTLIRHVPGKKTPELTIADIAPLQHLAELLRARLSIMAPADYEEVKGRVTARSDLPYRVATGNVTIKGSYAGKQEIQAVLKDINDLFRLAKDPAVNVDIDEIIEKYDEFLSLPVVEVEFTYLSRYEKLETGSLALLDTPGPNEAGQGATLRERLRSQLKRASVVLCVMDYTKLNSTDDSDVRKQIYDLRAIFEGRLYIAVNRFDEKKDGGMSVEEAQKYVSRLIADSLDVDGFDEGLVFPISSFLALLATRMQRLVSAWPGSLPSPEGDEYGWLNDFGTRAFGAEWEEMKEEDPIDLGVNRIERVVKRLLEKSNFPDLIAPVLQRSFERAGYESLGSALSRLYQYAGELDKFLEIGAVSLTKSIGQLQVTIERIQGTKEELERRQGEARQSVESELVAYRSRVDYLVADAKRATLEQLNSILRVEKQQLLDEFQSEIRKLDRELEELREERLLWMVPNSRRARKEERFLEKLLKEKKGSEPKFDINDPVVRFGEDAAEAERFLADVVERVIDALKEFSEAMEESLERCDSTSKQNLESQIRSSVERIGGRLQEQLEKDGYRFEERILPEFTLQPPEFAAGSSGLKGLRSQQTSREVKRTQKVMVKREGFIHGLLKLLSFGRRDDYDVHIKTSKVTVQEYSVDVGEIRKRASIELDELSRMWKESTETQFKTELIPLIEEQFELIQHSVENLIFDFEESKRRNELDRKNKEELHKAFTQRKSQNSPILQRSRVARDGLASM